MIFIKNICIFILLILISRFSPTYLNQNSINDQYTGVNINNNNIVKRDIRSKNINPWKFPIKYYIMRSLPQESIKKAINHLESNTCITFKQENSIFNNTNGLIFAKGLSCETFVGIYRYNKPNYVYLTNKCANDPMDVLHELGHSIGMLHEHNRKDRDKYVKINKDYLENYYDPETKKYTNIFKTEFAIKNYSEYENYYCSYDYSSLMHYSQFAYSSSFYAPVIESKLNPLHSKMMGQHEKMTFNDYKKINLAICNPCGWIDEYTKKKKLFDYKNAECLNDGYPDFRNCSKCICPSGYTGNLCKTILDSDKECNGTEFSATSEYLTLLYTGQKTCYIYLTASYGKKIFFIIHYYNAPYKDKICTDSVGYEIKYFKDNGATGLLLCGHNSKRTEVKSESNTLLVIYKGNSGHSLLVFSFKETE